MVHALDEIRRTLKPNGLLIDLRPIEDNWAVEVQTDMRVDVAGRLIDLPAGLADTTACFDALREVESRGWFIQEHAEKFTFFYYWDTPSAMKDYIDTEWAGYEKIEAEVYERAVSLWASANAEARLRVHRKMLIACWRKSAKFHPSI